MVSNFHLKSLKYVMQLSNLTLQQKVLTLCNSKSSESILMTGRDKDRAQTALQITISRRIRSDLSLKQHGEIAREKYLKALSV